MGRGRPPTPTAILKLQGGWRAKVREKEGGEPKPKLGRPRCPAWLDKESKAHWKAIVPGLEAQGVLATIDGDALAIYCQTWSQWRACVDYIREHGQIMCGKIRAEATLAGRLVQVLNRCHADFGMNPGARTRIRTDATASTQDKFSKFSDRKKA